jgi:hypothetical protein
VAKRTIVSSTVIRLKDFLVRPIVMIAMWQWENTITPDATLSVALLAKDNSP